MGASGGDWDVTGNWNLARIPNDTDVVCIPDDATVVHSTGQTIVRYLLSDGDITLSGGSLAAAEESHVQNLDLSGGTISSGSELTVTASLSWSSGSLGGSGTTVVAPGAAGVISGSGTKTLTGLLRNDGNITWSAGTLEMASGGNGPHLDNAGALTISGAVTTTTVTNEDTPRITNRVGA
ncbi:MAG: hypothetical protein M5U19_07345 [Microthrixaceae bacterium]|nr:hypothetical protein [Microthrixaceae bacterium]